MLRTGRAVTMTVLMMLTAASCGGGEAPATPTIRPSSTTGAPTSATSTTSSAVAGPLDGRVVVLDPGHNWQNFAHPEEIGRLVDIGNGTKACNTTGTETADGYTEALFTWEVATLARLELEALGAMVVLTRQDNDGWGPCITARAAIGNEAQADAVVSIHADGGPEAGRGYHVIHPKPIAGLTDDIPSPRSTSHGLCSTPTPPPGSHRPITRQWAVSRPAMTSAGSACRMSLLSSSRPGTCAIPSRPPCWSTRPSRTGSPSPSPRLS